MLSAQRRQRNRQPGRTNYRVAWEGEGCERHDAKSCRCTLVVRLPHVQDIVIRIPRIESGRVLTLEEQYLRVVQACVRYDVVQQVDGTYRATLITEAGVANDHISLVYFQYYGQRDSNRIIRPPFEVKNDPKPFVVKWDPRLRAIIDSMDRIYMQAYGRELPKIALRDEEFGPGKTPSATRQWYNRHLISRHVYGRHYGMSAIVHTMEDVSADKMGDLFAEFSQNNTESREHFDELKKLLPRAMMILESMLRVQQHYGTVSFRYCPEMLKKYVTNMQASAGVRPGPVKQEELCGLPVNMTTTGKKFHQFPYYAAEFHEMMRDLWEAEDIYDWYKGDRDEYCIIRLKNEFKVKWLADIPENEMEQTLAKLRKTCREFFIPNMLQQFLSRTIMTPKQLFERGDVIRIGQKWKHGGAQRFAERHHAGSKRHVWYTGDVRKLDKNIRDWLLSLYIVSGRKYFRDEDVKTEQFLDRLFVMLAERINVKLTCHITGIWTLMKGVMYSGGFETSHGDSWCLALVFCLYFASVMAEHPGVASDIVYCIVYWEIVLALYGDDHLLTVPRKLSAYINELGFAAFAKKMMGMEIREIEQLDDFFSTVDSGGELVKKGVVFLKRYFVVMPRVSPQYPYIYPFKPTHETVLKLVCNKENDPRVYPLQAIGQAYDTYGTNPVAYEMVRIFYEEWMSCLNFDQESITMMVDALDCQTRNRLWRKCGLNWRTSTLCFPRLEHLQQLHKIDDVQNSNVVPPAVVQKFYGYDTAPEEEELVSEWLGDYKWD